MCTSSRLSLWRTSQSTDKTFHNLNKENKFPHQHTMTDHMWRISIKQSITESRYVCTMQVHARICYALWVILHNRPCKWMSTTLHTHKKWFHLDEGHQQTYLSVSWRDIYNCFSRGNGRGIILHGHMLSQIRFGIAPLKAKLTSPGQNRPAHTYEDTDTSNAMVRTQLSTDVMAWSTPSFVSTYWHDGDTALGKQWNEQDAAQNHWHDPTQLCTEVMTWSKHSFVPKYQHNQNAALYRRNNII